MEAPIAIIGWGSLIWDLESLRSHVQGGWRLGVGPQLPLEFSRVSAKRKRALAVCVDLMDGLPCQTAIIPSKRGTLAEARTDLARRERAPEGFIGAYCAQTRQQWGRPQAAMLVARWCHAGGWAGAVWTDLHANFTAETGLVFSVGAACDHLKSLEDESLTEAVRYIENAPPATSTTLRRHLRKDTWWQEQVDRVMAG